MKVKSLKEWATEVSTWMATAKNWMLSPYLKKTGGEPMYFAERTDTGTKIGFGVGNSGTNHGIYSYKQSKWLIYGDNGSSVYVNNMKVANMVVEQGSSGIWNYRKWNDGTCEAWGVTASRSYAMTSQSGNGYYVTSSQSLPSGLFTAVHTAFANRSGGNGLVFISINGLSTSQISYYVSCTLSFTASFNIYLYVKGRWK